MSATTSIRPVSPFAIATLAPIPLLVLGGLFGSVFIWSALLYMTLLTMVLDGMFRTAGGDAAGGVEWPDGEKLSQGLAAAHFVLLIIGILAVQGATVSGWSGFAALLAFGMFFGQVSNSNAHELIHRTDRLSFNLGKWVLISLLYGHHVSAHRHIHHRFVGTPQDPNSAPLGEGFWAFAPRAWIDAFVAGWEVENFMAAEAGKELPPWKHPYVEYVGGAVGLILLVGLLFGFSGVLAYLLLALYAQLQLLLSDYVQHYGLRRRQLEGDDYEPVAPWHSWNSSHWFSSGLMLNAPRHSDHHMHPARPYPELAIPDHMSGPRLPYSLPVMAAVALIPPVWRSMMDKRAVAWQERIDAGKIENTRLPMPSASAKPAAPLRSSRRAAEAEPADDAMASRITAALAEEEAPAPVENEEVAIDPDATERAAPAVRRGVLSAQIGSRRRARLDPAAPAVATADAELEAAGDEPVEPVEPVAAADSMESAISDLVRASDEDDVAPTPRRPDPALDDEDTIVAPSSSLWNDPDAEPEPEPEPEPADRFVTSSSLYADDATSEEDRLTAALRAAGIEPGSGDADEIDDEEDTPAVGIEDAVAGVMADVRKAERRKRAGKFPTIEPEETAEARAAAPGRRASVGSVFRSAGLAARGVAAVLRGAPAPRPVARVDEEPVDEE